jgi:hypothetical protein
MVRSLTQNIVEPVARCGGGELDMGLLVWFLLFIRR